MNNNTENQTIDFEDSASNQYSEQVSQEFLDVKSDYYKDLEEILAGQKENLKLNLSLNIKLKENFFWICSTIMIIECAMQVVVLFVAMFGIFDADSFAIILSGVASITGTFLATFIILPKIIAKYLFDPNEQSNIHETIKHLRKSLK